MRPRGGQRPRANARGSRKDQLRVLAGRLCRSVEQVQRRRGVRLTQARFREHNARFQRKRVLLQTGELGRGMRHRCFGLGKLTAFDEDPRELNVDHRHAFVELCSLHRASRFLQQRLGLGKTALIDENFADVEAGIRAPDRVAGAQVEFATGAQPLDRFVPSARMRVQKTEIRPDVGLHAQIAHRFEDRQRFLQIGPVAGPLERGAREIDHDQRAPQRQTLVGAARFSHGGVCARERATRAILPELHHRGEGSAGARAPVPLAA